MLRWKTARHLDVNVGGQDNTWRDSKRVAPRSTHELDFLKRDVTQYSANPTLQEKVYMDQAVLDYKERADAERYQQQE